jgi:hypothetical protein
VLPARWDDRWVLQPVARMATAVGVQSDPDAGTVLLFGDLAGGPGPEVVLFGSGTLLIYTPEGELVVKRIFPTPMQAGLLADYDGDGKADIFVGTAGAARPAISVVNGRGDTIFEYRVPDGAPDYRSFLPVGVERGRLYVLARESWPDSPRGLLCYRVPGFETVWEFALPSTPLGVAVQRRRDGSAVFTFSGSAPAQGVFQRLGKYLGPAGTLDAEVRLFRADADGEVVDKAAVTVDGRTLAGTATFMPLEDDPDGRILMVHRPAQDPDYATPAVLYLIDPASAASVAAYPLGAERLAGLRVVPTKQGPRIILLTDAPGGESLLRLLDGDLRVLAQAAIAAGSARLGTVLMPPAKEEDGIRFFVFAPGDLWLYDASLGCRVVAAADGITQMVTSVSADGGWVVLLGRELRTFRVLRGAFGR